MDEEKQERTMEREAERKRGVVRNFAIHGIGRPLETAHRSAACISLQHSPEQKNKLLLEVNFALIFFEWRGHRVSPENIFCVWWSQKWRQL